MLLVDTHCHLTSPPLAGQVDVVLDAAAAVGVGLVIVPGIDGASSREAVALAARFPGRVFAAVGDHPQVDAAQATDLRLLRELAVQPGVVAMGEIGLDGELATPGLDVQEARLRAQLRLARELGLPVLLHCRKSWARFATILREELPGGPGGVLHAWAGSAELYRELAPLGLLCGVAGVVTWPVARRLRATLAHIPPSQLLLETDAPYIGTASRPRGTVRPQELPEILHALAALTGLAPAELARATTANARRLFGLDRGILPAGPPGPAGPQ